MRTVARLPDSDRGELFRNTADKMGLNDAIVEKDFWVCFTLDHLFHRCPWKDAITFKGGTSLSKAFNLISRFSEDIDLILDWRVELWSVIPIISSFCLRAASRMDRGLISRSPQGDNTVWICKSARSIDLIFLPVKVQIFPL